MARYRRMTDPGYSSPFISRMPGVPASMEDDRPPTYEYKDKLDDDDDPNEWEERQEYGWNIEDSPSYQKAMDDAWWNVAVFLAGLSLVLILLWWLILPPATV